MYFNKLLGADILHVLVVSQYFWPENFRINDLVSGLVKRGHDVTVLTGIPNYPDGHFFPNFGLFSNIRQEYNGAQVIRVPLLPRGNGSGIMLAFNYFSFAFSASALGPFFCRDNYDLIFVFEPSPITVGLPALVLKKLKSLPIVFWVQDLWPESLSATGAVNSPRVISSVTSMVKMIYAGCDLILVTSQTYIDKIQSLGVDFNKIRYFPQCAEEIYQPVAATFDMPENRRMPEGFRIMFAGNIGAAQDFPTILNTAELLKDHRDIHWLIVGDGRKRSWVDDEIERRHLHGAVHLLGRHPVEFMPRFFSLADVMLVTLKKEAIFALTIPAKVQSYMACGKPIIAALEGEGGRLIAESGSGVCCNSEDPHALASAVLKMHSMSKPQLEKLGKKGREYYLSNFERNMLLDRLEMWMFELLKRSV